MALVVYACIPFFFQFFSGKLDEYFAVEMARLHMSEDPTVIWLGTIKRKRSRS
jgi:hypothetical protein